MPVDCAKDPRVEDRNCFRKQVQRQFLMVLLMPVLELRQTKQFSNINARFFGYRIIRNNLRSLECDEKVRKW